MRQLLPNAKSGSHGPTVLADIVRGAVQGDFARDLGLPGAVTQVALSFVPVVGTLCAAPRRVRSRLPLERLHL